MELRFLLRNVKATKAIDHGNIFNPIDLYFTYSVFSGKGDEFSQLAQGFSAGCSIEHGHEFLKGDQRELNDPNFIIDLPELNEGEEQRVTLNLYAWDSDADATTRLIKGYFTNQSVEKLLTIYDENVERAKEAREAFVTWLKSAIDTGLTLAAPLAGAALPWVVLGAKAAPVAIDGALAIARMSGSQMDDYIGVNRLDFWYKKENGETRFRWMINDGVETWASAETPFVYLDFTYESDRRDIALACTASLKVML